MKFSKQQPGESDSAYFHRLYSTIHQTQTEDKTMGQHKKKGSARKTRYTSKGKAKITSGKTFTNAGKRLKKLRPKIKLSSASYNTLAKRQAALKRIGASGVSTRTGGVRTTSRRAYKGGKSTFAKLGAQLKKLNKRLKISSKKYDTVAKRRAAIAKYR